MASALAISYSDIGDAGTSGDCVGTRSVLSATMPDWAWSTINKVDLLEIH